ncbi:MAG: DUF4258 domain-containing protein [Anaerolineae bacterium]|nr:DUF4258 domain-containing protein [Anaerolineae bacterium]
MQDFLRQIRERVKRKEYQISAHAEIEREAEEITIPEIVEAVLTGEILEDYPQDPRGHSCLILGFTNAGRAIHSVWTIIPDGRARLITVYIPQLPKWIDPHTRNRSMTQ